MRQFFLAILCIAWVHGWGQTSATQDLLLEAGFRHPCFQTFVSQDSSGLPRIRAILANNWLPQRESISCMGLSLPVHAGREVNERHLIRIDKLRFRDGKARLNFSYDQRVRARMWLAEETAGEWKVRRAIVSRKVRNSSGRRGTQFCVRL
ncbi:MAG: hypothetical protein OHK0039_18300 [Bacteroidia bacterium]